MSGFHYVRTYGPQGGVDAVEDTAIGLDLATVLRDGALPWRIVFDLVVGLAELFAIADADGVCHGDVQLKHVRIDETGAISVEGFGQRNTRAPESLPTLASDRFGLGLVIYELMDGRPPELTTEPTLYDNLLVDRVLALPVDELPERLASDLQWLMARLLAWRPAERPTAERVWNTLDPLLDDVIGPSFTSWCSEAIDGGGQRRDGRGTARPTDSMVTRRAGPIAGGGVNFGDTAAPGRSTNAWTRDGMKQALERASSDELPGDNPTQWPDESPSQRTSTAPRRAPGTGKHRLEDLHRDAEPDEDERTEHSSPLASILRNPTPPPSFQRQVGPAPEVPKPRAAFLTPPPTRPRRNLPEPDANTAPRLQAPPPAAPEPVVLPASNVEPPPEPTAKPPESDRMTRPLTDVALPKGPDPFANMEETDDSNTVVYAAIGVFAAVATLFCLGVGGLGGVAAVMGMGPEETVAQNQTPDPNRRVRSPDTPGVRPSQPVPKPIRPRPTRIQPTPPPQPAQPAGIRAPRPAPPSRPEPVGERPPTRPTPRPSLPIAGAKPTPRPAPPPRPVPAPSTGRSDPPPLPFTESPTVSPRLPLPPAPATGAVTDALQPGRPVDPMRGPNDMQMAMRAHLSTANAAKDAVVRGDVAAARQAAQSLNFINPPASMPPSWLPYLTDMKVEAWMMENSPDLPSVAFKVAQLGQACATCHAGVRAGPTVNASAIPPATFQQQDVMLKHAWATDWMWVGLLANDGNAWMRGTTELDQTAFPSVTLDDFPDRTFMDLEDRLHTLANEAKRASTHDQRGLVFGKLLSTCSRCHVAYRAAGL